MSGALARKTKRVGDSVARGWNHLDASYSHGYWLRFQMGQSARIPTCGLSVCPELCHYMASLVFLCGGSGHKI